MTMDLIVIYRGGMIRRGLHAVKLLFACLDFVLEKLGPSSTPGLKRACTLLKSFHEWRTL